MGSANDEFDRLWARSGWKQARVARELGVSTATVARYVSREIKPSRPVPLRLSDLLNIPLLLDGEEYRPSSLSDGPRWLTDWEVNAITILRRLDAAARDRVIRSIAEIVDAITNPPRYKISRKAKGKKADGDPPKQKEITAFSVAQEMAKALARDSSNQGAKPASATPGEASGPGLLPKASESPQPANPPHAGGGGTFVSGNPKKSRKKSDSVDFS